MIIKPSLGVNCCDIKELAGINSRVGKVQNTCIFRSRSAKRSFPTPSQSERRSVFKSVIDLWRTLTTPQKEDWADFAASQPLENACGDVFFDSAFRWFARINGVLVNFGADKMLSNPPDDYISPAVDVPVTTKFSNFCFFSKEVLTASIDPPAGRGVAIFGLVGETDQINVMANRSNMLFATTQTDDPIWGSPPEVGLDPSIPPLWFIALRVAWHFVFRPSRGAAQPPNLS